MKKITSKSLYLIASIACLYNLNSYASDEVQKPEKETVVSARLDQESLVFGPDNTMFVSGRQLVGDKEINQLFVVTQINTGGTKLNPIIRQKAVVDTEISRGEIENPLWNKKIKLFVPCGKNIVLFVLQDEPQSIYSLIYAATANRVSKLNEVQTEEKQPCENILSVALINGGYVCVLAQQKADAPFGHEGTGIALLKIDQSTPKEVIIEDKKVPTTFITLHQNVRAPEIKIEQTEPEKNAQGKFVAPFEHAIEYEEDIEKKDESSSTELLKSKKSKPVKVPFFFDIGKSTHLSGILNDIESITPGSGLCFDPISNDLILSLACKTKSTNNAMVHVTFVMRSHVFVEEATQDNVGQEVLPDTDNGEQTVVQRIEHKRFLMHSVCKQIKSVAGAGNNYILASDRPGDLIKNDQIKLMEMPTGYYYCIVRSQTEDGKKRLFMLPAILTSNNLLTLAHKASLLQKSINPKKRMRRSSRVDLSMSPAHDVADIPHMNEKDFLIDTTDLPGQITHVEVAGESIIVSTASQSTDDSQLTGGLFRAQALYDPNGKISGWTKWKRVNSITESVHRFCINPINPGTIFYVSTEKKEDIIKSTVFDVRSALAKPYANSSFESVGGVRIIENFFTGSPDCPDNIVALMTQSDLILVNAGQGACRLETLFDDLQHSIRLPLKEVVATIGTCKNVVVAHNHITMQSWVMLLGERGIAVLTGANGLGIPAPASGAEFLAHVKQQQFTYIKPDFHIKKMVAAHGSLFIVSDKELYRVDFNGSDTQSFMHTAVTLLDSKDDPNRLLYDVVVSGPVIALATSGGLLRNGDGTAAGNIGIDQEAQWVPVELPYQVRPTIALYHVAQNLTDIDASNASMLYVISSFRGQRKTTVHRLAIMQDDVMSSQTLSLVNEARYMDQIPFLVTHAYQDHIFSDGIHYYCIYKNKTGSYLTQVEGLKVIPYNLSKDEQVYTISYCQATGQYLVGGSKNLYISK